MTRAHEPGDGEHYATGATGAAGTAPGRARLRWVGFVVSIVLVVAAAWAVRGQWDSLGQALRTGSGRWELLALAAGLPLLNWLLTSGAFYFLMRPATCRGESRPSDSEHVSPGEMALLIGSAWLLNYLPLSPGMLGRVAYLKSVLRFGVWVSVRGLVAALVIGVVVVGAMLGEVVVAGRGLSANAYAAMLGLPPVALLIVAWVGWWVGRCQGGWRYAAVAALRWLDVLVWMARYAVVFELIGRSLSLAEAAAIAAASQAAMQVPLVGNGLGVREWAVGLVGPVRPGWRPGGAGGLSRGMGLSADLIKRGVELVAAVPVGLVVRPFWPEKQGIGPLAFRSSANVGRSEV